ncbi:hypothetical protein ABPG72_021775 [Tetrahymena utriculariae]
MEKQFDVLLKRLNNLETLLGENLNIQSEQNGGEQINPLVDKLNKAELKLKDIISNVTNGATFVQGQNTEISKSIQSINDFLRNSEMKYATAIIGSKNRADLLLRQEQEILQVVELLEQIEKNRKMICFDPILQVEEKMKMVEAFEFMSEISSQGGPLKVNKTSDQTVAETYIQQNEDIEQLIKDQADIIDTINKKFLYFDAVLTQLENKK